jgi:hypothetical protein
MPAIDRMKHRHSNRSLLAFPQATSPRTIFSQTQRAFALIPTLDPARWECDFNQAGAGYFVELDSFACGWLDISKLRAVSEAGKKFYESPAVIGCALAVSRSLYEKLRGFDPHMRLWGLEDLDFGLKCWLMGHRVLHDPLAVVGHRFRKSFDNFSVPMEQVVANQLRMARKNFTHSVWCEWAERCRQRHQGSLADYPQGVWTRSWQLFEADRASVELERSYLHGQRVRDEFWFAERFGQSWPRLGSERTIHPKPQRDVGPDPSAPPQCNVTGITPSASGADTYVSVSFTADGNNLDQVQWDAGSDEYAFPNSGSGASFSTLWTYPGVYTVTASCGGTNQTTDIIVRYPPSPSPSPCQLNQIDPEMVSLQVGEAGTFTATGQNLSTVQWSSEPAGVELSGETGEDYSVVWIDPGTKTITASCGAVQLAATATVVNIKFSDDTIKTGFSMLPNQDIKKSVTVTVEPKAETANVDISIAPGPGGNRATIVNLVKDVAGGTITFDVQGQDATPVNMPQGDTTIEARHMGNLMAMAQVLVLVPTTHTRQLPPTTYQNVVIPLGTGAKLVTLAERNVTISVQDQFGNILDSIYDGSSVVEEIFTNTEGFCNLLPTNTPNAIIFPDDVFKNGEKKDLVQLSVSYRTDAILTNAEIAQWESFSYVPPPIDPQFNNAFALNLENNKSGGPFYAYSKVLQEIQVHGHTTQFKTQGQLYPNAKRELTLTMVDFLPLDNIYPALFVDSAP